jgi:hypothetical protein
MIVSIDTISINLLIHRRLCPAMGTSTHVRYRLHLHGNSHTYAGTATSSKNHHICAGTTTPTWERLHLYGYDHIYAGTTTPMREQLHLLWNSYASEIWLHQKNMLLLWGAYTTMYSNTYEIHLYLLGTPCTYDLRWYENMTPAMKHRQS